MGREKKEETISIDRIKNGWLLKIVVVDLHGNLEDSFHKREMFFSTLKELLSYLERAESSGSIFPSGELKIRGFEEIKRSRKSVITRAGEKLDTVFQEYRKLSGLTPEAVELDQLVKAIVGTGRFNESGARTFLEKLKRKGLFSLAKPIYYRRV